MVKGVQVNTARNVTIALTRRLICLSPVLRFIAAKYWCRNIPGVTSERMRPPNVTPLNIWQEILYPSVRRYTDYLDTLLQFLGARCWWRSWLRHCATSRKVAGSIPDGVIGIFH